MLGHREHNEATLPIDLKTEAIGDNVKESTADRLLCLCYSDCLVVAVSQSKP